MLDHALVALAGLGFFLTGLTLLADTVRSLAARRIRVALLRLSKAPLSSALMGSLLGAVTQSTSAASYVCMGLLNSNAINFPMALSISAWSGVGTSILVFLASVDLRLAALLALSLIALLHLTSLHRNDPGRRTTELLLAAGLTLLGLAMVKDAGHVMEQNQWAQEFFAFSSESWVYGFLIGLVVTLVMQSSSTVSILAVALSATGLLPVRDAIVIVCGANLGSGMSVALISSHLTGQPLQLALWQAIVKGLGSLSCLAVALILFSGGVIDDRITQLLAVPTIIAITYLLINLAGAVLSNIFRTPLMRLLAAFAPVDPERQQFEPEYIIDEAAEDPAVAMLLAQREQYRLIRLLPDALGPLRGEEADNRGILGNDQRRELAVALAERISGFVSEAVERHPKDADVKGLLVLQRCNDHLGSIIEALHGYVAELGVLTSAAEHERTMSDLMTENLHFLLTLAGDQAAGEQEIGEMLKQLTEDRSEAMTRFRQQIVHRDMQSHTNREALFVATALFERMVWLIRQLSADLEPVSAGDRRTTT